MEILTILAVLSGTAVSFVLLQHGLSNTLKSIGIAFLRAGKARERKVQERRSTVDEQMVREMGS